MTDKIPGGQLAEALKPLLDLVGLEPEDTFHIVVDPDEIQVYYFLLNADGNKYIDLLTDEPAMSRRVRKVSVL